MSEIDPRALRDAFGAFMTGVTVVTTFDESGAPRGFTANSFTSVSIDPPLLLVCPSKKSSNLDAFTQAKGFAVNILAESQQDISKTFASPVEDRFAGVTWRKGPCGSPLLEGVAAWFDCAHHETVDAGDHLILIGRVEAFENGRANGLGYARGGYFTADLESRAVAAAASDAKVMISAIIDRGGKVLLLEKDGKLALPAVQMSNKSGAALQLTPLFERLGIKASVGFIYSVYDQDGVQHLVYRCVAGKGKPGQGHFHDLASLDPARFKDKAMAIMLGRYGEESRFGNFGIYLGDAERGHVRRLTGEE